VRLDTTIIINRLKEGGNTRREGGSHDVGKIIPFFTDYTMPPLYSHDTNSDVQSRYSANLVRFHLLTEIPDLAPIPLRAPLHPVQMERIHVMTNPRLRVYKDINLTAEVTQIVISVSLWIMDDEELQLQLVLSVNTCGTGCSGT
jgi:hypothetical protein